jgi:hypothetical protein
LVIQGKVDDWRVQRTLSYNIYCSWVKDPVEITRYCSLPYDNEIDKLEKEEMDETLYALRVEEMRNFIWPSNN